MLPSALLKKMIKKINFFSLFLLFFMSGFSALIYQIAWQRALFTVLGSNIDSTTIIVSVFMFGLGTGSLCGALVSSRFSEKIIIIFSLLEILTGIYGFTSLGIIKFISDQRISSYFMTTCYAALILLVPTLLMGATLPLLTTHINKHFKNAGTSVATLYAFNTIGAAAASILTVVAAFELLGLRGSVNLAETLNLVVGTFIFIIFRKQR